MRPFRTDTCRHGHVGWMFKRYILDRRRAVPGGQTRDPVTGQFAPRTDEPEGRFYWVWVCRECVRLGSLEKSRRARAQAKAAA